MTVFGWIVASTLVPLFFLARWTLALEPGAGPQGGEVLFLGWLMLAMWLTLVTIGAAIRGTPTLPWYLRLVVVPAATFVATCVLFAAVFHLLNESSLAEVSRPSARVQVSVASALVALLVLVDVVLLRRR